MAQMLATVVNELQNKWDEQLSHAEFEYNVCVSAATSLAPNEVHMSRLPRLPLTIFERAGVAGLQSLARDRLAYCDLAADRQQRAYCLREPPQPRPLRRTASSLQFRRWRLDVSVQYGGYHPPGREA